MKTNYKIDWIGPLTAAFFCFYISFFMIGDYYFQPNAHMFAFGGDPLTIYYDFAYHICHGSGSNFSGMAYPTGEYIYLTDAEGAFANVFQWINQNVIEICDYSVGIVNGLNVWFLMLAAVIMYFLLNAFGVNKLLSILFAGPIILLSPQFIRIGGHFGLGYPFLIPMAILWFLRKRRVSSFEKRDLLVFATLLFFTFNNPYTGFSTAFILIGCGFISLIVDKKISYSNLAAMILPAICLVIAYGFFKLNDPYHDRIALQWGFFNYKANLEGFIAPSSSVMDTIIKYFNEKGFKVGFEASQNIGIATIIAFLSLAIFKIKNRKTVVFPREYKIFIGAASLIFLYASAVIFSPFDREWVEEVLGSLLMFKASARMAWSLYFALTIGSVIIVHQLTKNIDHLIFKRLVYIIFLALWVFEIKHYMGPKFEKKHYENHFSINKNKEIEKVLTTANIDTSNFQAILALPKMMSWSDKFMGNDYWNTQYYSMRTSLVSGIPMISAMLSRLPVSVSTSRLEFISNPLIERSLLNEFHNNKDLLLVVGTPHPQKPGERFLISIADTLYEDKNYGLYRLPINRINENVYVKEARSMSRDIFNNNQNVTHLSFNDMILSPNFYGNGALHLSKGSHVILDTLINIDTTKSFQFSAWTHIDNKRYGMGSWELFINDKNGKEINKIVIPTRESNDVQDDWIRSEASFEIANGSKVKAVFIGNQEFTIDEVILRPQSQNHVSINSSSEWILFNGFKVRKNPL